VFVLNIYFPSSFNSTSLSFIVTLKLSKPEPSSLADAVISALSYEYIFVLSVTKFTTGFTLSINIFFSKVTWFPAQSNAITTKEYSPLILLAIEIVPSLFSFIDIVLSLNLTIYHDMLDISLLETLKSILSFLNEYSGIPSTEISNFFSSVSGL